VQREARAANTLAFRRSFVADWAQASLFPAGRWRPQPSQHPPSPFRQSTGIQPSVFLTRLRSNIPYIVSSSWACVVSHQMTNNTPVCPPITRRVLRSRTNCAIQNSGRLSFSGMVHAVSHSYHSSSEGKLISQQEKRVYLMFSQEDSSPKPTNPLSLKIMSTTFTSIINISSSRYGTPQAKKNSID